MRLSRPPQPPVDGLSASTVQVHTSHTGIHRSPHASAAEPSGAGWDDARRPRRGGTARRDPFATTRGEPRTTSATGTHRHLVKGQCRVPAGTTGSTIHRSWHSSRFGAAAPQTQPPRHLDRDPGPQGRLGAGDRLEMAWSPAIDWLQQKRVF
ncbi:hypothetical protein GCM10009700_33470 [Brevibacterium sanguinis]